MVHTGFQKLIHIGGFYDFTADLASKDTAYTSQALGAHTDNAYFSVPSRLQMFHLLHHKNGSGGESLLVDGLRCMALLKKQNKQAYNILHETKLYWHASGNEGITITPSRSYPIIEILDSNHLGNMRRLRWNNDDRGSFFYNDFTGNHEDKRRAVAEWYEAARAFDSLLKAPENQYWEQLKPGRPLSTILPCV